MAKTETEKENRYEQRGVSSEKEDVHNAIKNLSQGLYPNAFCKILPDVLGGDPLYCNISHADGAGTKSSLAYVYWRETGDLSVWKGVAQDALVMNLDDMICVGAGLQDEEFLYSLSIDRNKNFIPGEVIKAIITGTQELIDLLANYGIKIHFAGGETADVGDLVRTITVNGTMTTRMLRKHVIVPKIIPGHVIVGFSSQGQAKYESDFNSGIGSNGLTSARHDLLHASTGIKYPESFDSMMPRDLVYVGNNKLTDKFIEDITVGKSILSPTRTYAPLLKKLAERFFKKGIILDSYLGGIIHCSGGGQTKVKKFIPNDVVVTKEFPPHIPKLFDIIQSETQTDWKEMFQTFNMGYRMEIYCNEGFAQELITTAKSLDVEAEIIGHCSFRTEHEQRSLVVNFGGVRYSF